MKSNYSPIDYSDSCTALCMWEFGRSFEFGKVVIASYVFIYSNTSVYCLCH